MKEVVDSRFLIEHLYSANVGTRQRTSRKLAELIRRKDGILPAIVISETVKIICEKVGRGEAETSYLSLIGSGLQLQRMDEDIAKHAGLLRCQHRNLPMGDCIVAATAIGSNAKVLSDDPHFDVVRGIKRTWI